MLESSTVQGRTRLPKITHREFDADNPSLWFLELELRLEASGVAEELPRFTLLTGLLTNDQALSITQVTESVSKNTCLNPYTNAKTVLLKRYATPWYRLISKAFSIPRDGGSKPSEQNSKSSCF